MQKARDLESRNRITRHRPRTRRQSNARYAALMGGPAFLWLTLFLLVPFGLAFVFSFTNQRLFSPNPTQFVGLRNYDRLLSIGVLHLETLKEEGSEELQRGVDGSTQYESPRSLLLEDERYYGFRPWFEASLLGQRYAVIAKDPTFYRSLFNTALFALIVVPLQTAVGLLLALLLNQKVPGVSFFRVVYFMPGVTSIVVIGIIWIFLYNKDAGMINQLLPALSFGLFKPVDWLGDPRTAMLAIGLMTVWASVGFQMVIYLAGLQGIPSQLYEAASIDGANVWQKLLHITIPGLRNTTIFIVILTTIGAFSLFTQVDVMTKGGPLNATTTVMYHIVTKGTREQDISYASAMSVVYLLIILAIALVQRGLLMERR